MSDLDEALRDLEKQVNDFTLVKYLKLGAQTQTKKGLPKNGGANASPYCISPINPY